MLQTPVFEELREKPKRACRGARSRSDPGDSRARSAGR